VPNRLPRTHWPLLLPVCLVLQVELCFSGYVNRAAGEGPRQPAADGPDPALPAGSGPVLRIDGRKVVRAAMPPQTVALTYDDGSDPRWAPQIPDALKAAHAHATFFVIGSPVNRWRLAPLWVVPLQQRLYRQLLYLVVVQSAVAALLGGRQRWAPMARSGREESTVGGAVVAGP
jgi:hypothetical protein